VNTPSWLEGAGLQAAGLILMGHRRAWGRPLLAGPGLDAEDGSSEDDGGSGGAGSGGASLRAAQELFAAEVVVLAHDDGEDPRLIYANRAALRLWRRRWGEMVGMPSRLTAAPGERRERASALERARRGDALEGYGGVRIDAAGRPFRIEGARLWTLWDRAGRRCGQAACFANWWWL
jgi:hypothetical protein